MTRHEIGDASGLGSKDGGGWCSARRRRWTALGPLLLVVASTLAADELPAKFGEEAARMAAKRREQIQAELAELAGGHAWAGTYYEGDGLGVNVSMTLAPKSGYLFQWRGCLGLYDRNFGEINVVDDRLRLSFTYENDQRGFQGIAPEFLPIAWGERRYLIPADDVIGFCNAINENEEPRSTIHGGYLLRLGDEKKAVSGQPDLGAEFEGYLLAKPIEARVIRVGKAQVRKGAADIVFRDFQLTLDAGAAEGLRVGMAMHVTKPNIVQSLKITKVEEHTAEALVITVDSDARPRKDWVFSTRPSWRRSPNPMRVDQPTSPTSQPASAPAPGAAAAR